jgi:hypothetical protein
MIEIKPGEFIKELRLHFRDFSIDFLRRDFQESDTLADLDDFIEHWVNKRFKIEEPPK